ncbi:nuclear transport factor 2 family protein [Streptomyces umbrinus]|uniref:nuclear transport factor 2 family protein n=1 Tax=Streptomyces umbrinus TaxID=67370 RepID=UPI003C30171F
MDTNASALQPRPAWATADGHITVNGPDTASAVSGDAAPGADQEPGRLSQQHSLDRTLAVETVYRFAFSFGERDRQVLTDCFTHDVVFESNIGGNLPVGPFEGRQDLVDWLTGYWPRQTDQRRHFVTNTLVDDLTDESATVTTMLTLAGSENGAMRLITAGFYRCELRKEEDGAWRIAHFCAGYDASY